MGDRLLDPRAAAEAVIERAPGPRPEAVSLDDALGRVLAADVESRDDVPGFDNSAMDGFAVRAADTAAAMPAEPALLTLVGESRAGRPYDGTIQPGQAVVISTGAMLPRGADAVLRIEDADQRGMELRASSPLPPGKEVRRAGEDLRGGQTALTAGIRLGPAELGVAASVGVAELPCAIQPRVAVVVTGDELVEPPAPLGPGQIRNTNGHAMRAQAAEAGAVVERVMHVGDDRPATVDALRRALDADVVIATGGVSVGPHDHVRPAMAELGVEQVFSGVALRPGKPTWFGVAHRPAGLVLVFGLPGNPVSAMVTFHLFARPALACMLGTSPRERRSVATMDVDYRKPPGRAHVVRCKLETRDDGWHVSPTKAQGSHVLTSMLNVGALVYLEVERGDVNAGERVEIEIL